MFVRDVVRDAALDALAVLLPVECAGCGRPDRVLCTECRTACAVGSRANRLTVRTLDDGTRVVSALRYEGVVRSVILAFKEHGRTSLARPLGAALAAALEHSASLSTAEQVPGPVSPGSRARAGLELCPVPSTRAGRRARGYHPVGLLVRAAGFRGCRALEVSASTVKQKSLGRADRGRNLRGSLRVRRPLRGERFIVIDDVVTTGATLTEAIRAIREAGGEVVACATLAFTPLIFGDTTTRVVTKT